MQPFLTLMGLGIALNADADPVQRIFILTAQFVASAQVGCRSRVP